MIEDIIETRCTFCGAKYDICNVHPENGCEYANNVSYPFGHPIVIKLEKRIIELEEENAGLRETDEPIEKNTEELKQCPFCYGHEIHGDEIDSTLLTTDEKEWRQVVCNYCGAGGEMDLELSVAIKAWNTRPIEDDLNEQIKELEKDNRSAKHAIDVWHDSYIELEKQFYAMKKTNLEGKN